MVNIQEISSSFALFADLSPEEMQRYTPIIELAATEISGRLKAGADAPENAERITLLSAANAYYKYTLLTASQGCGTIKLGDVSVAGDPRGEEQSARAVLEDFMASCSDILADNGFVFGQVGV